MLSRIEDLGVKNTPLSALLDESTQRLYESPFDPVNFLNETLPGLSFSSNQAASSKNGRLTQIQHASSEIQSLLTKLNTHNIRCSNSLTQLTDEILRSGSRLAYEVEILRGDVNSLYNALTDTLHDDIKKFVRDRTSAETVETPEDGSREISTTDAIADEDKILSGESRIEHPEFITKLQTLSLIKSRLEAVINVFGEAMQWPLPPSEISMTSSLISVSAPELGMINTSQDDKAREIAKKLRSDVADLLESDGGGYSGLEAATKRVEELRNLASIWKGTAEEKPRTRVVDGIAKVVEDRRKALEVRPPPQRSNDDSSIQRSSSTPVRPIAGQGRTDSNNPAAGLFRNLQRLKDEIYLE